MFRSPTTKLFRACALTLTLAVSSIGCAMALQDLPSKDYLGNIKKDPDGKVKIGGRVLVGGPFNPRVVELYPEKPIQETQEIEVTRKEKTSPQPQTQQLPETIPVEWNYTGCKGEKKKKVVQAKVPEEYRKPQPAGKTEPAEITGKTKITITRDGDTKVVTGPSPALQTATIIGAAGDTAAGVMLGFGAIKMSDAALQGKLASEGQTNVNYAEGGQGGNVEKGAVVNELQQSQEFYSKIDINVKQNNQNRGKKPRHDCSPGS